MVHAGKWQSSSKSTLSPATCWLSNMLKVKQCVAGRWMRGFASWVTHFFSCWNFEQPFLCFLKTYDKRCMLADCRNWFLTLAQTIKLWSSLANDLLQRWRSFNCYSLWKRCLRQTLEILLSLSSLFVPPSCHKIKYILLRAWRGDVCFRILFKCFQQSQSIINPLVFVCFLVTSIFNPPLPPYPLSLNAFMIFPPPLMFSLKLVITLAFGVKKE